VSHHSDISKIAVVGGGSWATALVKILSEKEVNINWWLRNETDALYVQEFGRNPRYLSSARIRTHRVLPSTDLRKCIRNSNLVIFAIPAAFLSGVLARISPEELSDKIVITAIKGMIPTENLLISEYLEKHFDLSEERIACLAGPCHAEEVAMEKRSYLTLASENLTLAEELADLFRCHYISTTTNDDIYGVEYCAVMKNIVAIACGIANGLSYGDNFQSVLVSNAMQQIQLFLDKVHPVSRDVNSSAYLGDLLVTAYSQFSRNRTFGNMLGKGYSVKAAQMEMAMVAEGYYAVKCINEICRLAKVEIPFVSTVYNIIYEKISPIIEFKILETKMM
jgi:glycerol-3-phosphate dehydrogenase (NAD(P)+)